MNTLYLTYFFSIFVIMANSYGFINHNDKVGNIHPSFAANLMDNNIRIDIMKQCRVCKQTKTPEEFYKKTSSPDGYMGLCKICDSEKRLIHQHTKIGVVNRIYSTQVNNSKTRNHEPPAYTKQELKEWLFSQDKFHALYNNWVNSNYNKWLKPSCDRSDDYKGYSLDRLSVMTWQENFNKGHSDRASGINNKANKSITQLTKDNRFVRKYHSVNYAHRVNKFDVSFIIKCCKNKCEYAYGYKWEYAND